MTIRHALLAVGALMGHWRKTRACVGRCVARTWHDLLRKGMQGRHVRPTALDVYQLWG